MATALSDPGLNPVNVPPAVRYPLARGRGLRRLLTLVWGLVVAIDGYWLLVAPAGDWRPWAGVLVSVAAGAWTWRFAVLAASGHVNWDGSVWWWERASTLQGVPEMGCVALRMDMQSGMLLQFRADAGAVHWFWVERGASPDHWLALRRAVHGTARQGGAAGSAVAAKQAVVP